MPVLKLLKHNAKSIDVFIAIFVCIRVRIYVYVCTYTYVLIDIFGQEEILAQLTSLCSASSQLIPMLLILLG